MLQSKSEDGSDKNPCLERYASAMFIPCLSSDGAKGIVSVVNGPLRDGCENEVGTRIAESEPPLGPFTIENAL